MYGYTSSSREAIRVVSERLKDPTKGQGRDGTGARSEVVWGGMTSSGSSVPWLGGVAGRGRGRCVSR